MYSCGHYGVFLLGWPIISVVNAFDVFGGCVSLVWVGKLFGALNVNDIGVKIFCMVLVICGECY